MRIGVIVNPIAGVGGPLALKGSDGIDAAQARAVGADRRAAAKAVRALDTIAPLSARMELLCAGGDMGEEAAAAAGLPMEVLYRPEQPTGPADTVGAARAILRRDPDLILFAGGDGTARDLMKVIGEACPVLGIPAGVKMHSAVFARTPRDAGMLLAAIAAQRPEDRRFIVGEVLDRNEEGVPELFGSMRVPSDPRRMQPAKAAAVERSEAALEGASHALADVVRNSDRLAIIGPGSTTMRLKMLLSGGGTLLGVDLYREGRLLAKDADERSIIDALDERGAMLILGVIGGQGFLIGRGNQQISAEVIRRVGRDRITAIASAEKLAALMDRTLYADTGEDELDADLAGYIPVQVAGSRRVMMPLNSHLRRSSRGHS